MRIVSWRGWEPSDDGLWLHLNPSVLGAWNPSFNTVQRTGTTAVVTAVTIGDRIIDCVIGNIGTTPRSPQATWLLALERLNPLDTSPGELIVELEDASQWSVQAYLTLPGSLVDGTLDNYDVVFYTTDPVWHAITPETASSVVTATTITNATFATNTTGWTKSSDPANVTSAFSRDAAVYYDAAGSGKLVVSANTGAGGFVYVMNDTEFPIEPGELATIKCAVRTTNNYDPFGESGLGAWPIIRFYDASDSLLYTASDYPLSQNANEWVEMVNNSHLVPQYAPALSDYFKIGVQIQIDASQTGTVYFDAFEFVTGPFTSTPFTVEGNAPTNLTVTMTPAGNFPQAIAARTFTITNNGERTIYNHPFEVNLGDNSASPINGTYWALLRDGKPQPCQISDYDTVQAYVWLIIDHLAPGDSADYVLLVSDQTILANTTFNTITQPAFDISTAYVTTTTGSSSTVTKIPTGLGSEIDKWIGGYMTVLSGAQAGTTIEITDSTTISVTHAALGGGALASSVSVLVRMSSNSRWVYPVRKTERSGPRGLWWLSSGQKKPDDYSFETPGSWAHELYYDNNDQFVQKWNTPFDPGGGADYNAIFDTNRTWESGQKFLDAGGADGVAIFTPVPITAWQFDYQLKSPNSMALFVAGSRQSNGAAAWTHEYEDDGPYTTLTNVGIQNETLEADTYGVGMFLIPNGTDEIGDRWAKDDGTATSATATTLVDSNKDWIVDQWIGGTVRIVSGVGAGQTRAITDSAATSVTVASWGTQPDSTSRYIITNPPYVATARNHTYLHLTLDSSSIACSAVSAETDAFVLYRDLHLDWNDDGDPYQTVAINPETTDRYIVLFADESLVIDGPNMTAYVADSGTGAEIRTVPPMAYSVLDVDGDTRRLASSWLHVNPGEHTLSIAVDEAGVSCDVDVEWVEAVTA
jgi:hypothetical protein